MSLRKLKTKLSVNCLLALQLFHHLQNTILLHLWWLKIFIEQLTVDTNSFYHFTPKPGVSSCIIIFITRMSSLLMYVSFFFQVLPLETPTFEACSSTSVAKMLLFPELAYLKQTCAEESIRLPLKKWLYFIVESSKFSCIDKVGWCVGCPFGLCC